MSLGPHADFILAAYGIAAVTLGAVIAWVLLDYRAQRKIVRDLESQRRKR
jgi:heme exporter protein D